LPRRFYSPSTVHSWEISAVFSNILEAEQYFSAGRLTARCERGVRIATENWFALTASPREVDHILDSVGEDLGFLADTGNWSGPTKYAELKSIFARANLCHAKCHFGPGLDMDCDDYGKCIEAALDAGYAGPFTLVFESPSELWQGLEMERDFLLSAMR
jgi:sugar phosphate isomerase/epimerase